MSYTIIDYVSDGVTTTYAINFPLGYISQSDITCRINNAVDGFNQPVYSPITFISEGLVSIGTAPPSGQSIVFQRTVSVTSLVHDYMNGAIETDQNLNETAEQPIMLIQQLLDGLFPTPPPSAPNVGGYATVAQLATEVARAEAAEAALATSIAGATAAAIAAVQAQIATDIAAALAADNLKSGDRLLQHLYTSNASTATFSGTIPITSTPTSASGTQILSQTITPTTIGNTLSVSFQCNLSCASPDCFPAAILLMNGAFVSSSVIRQYGYTTVTEFTAILQYDIVASSLSPVTFSVNIGSSAYGTQNVQINTGNYGGQLATLVVEEIGIANNAPVVPNNSWNPSTIVYSGFSLNTSAQSVNTTNVVLSTDGSKLYGSEDGTGPTFEYAMSTPFNLSTAVYTGKAGAAMSQNGHGSAMSTDGTHFYEAGVVTGIEQYTLSTPYDISTATLQYTLPFTNAGNCIIVSADGLHAYVGNISTGTLTQYTLSAANDLRTATLVNISSVLSQDSYVISPDGKTIISTVVANGHVSVYHLGTAWDITTIGSPTLIGNLAPTIPNAAGGYGIAVSPDGTKLYASNDSLVITYEYILA